MSFPVKRVDLPSEPAPPVQDVADPPASHPTAKQTHHHPKGPSPSGTSGSAPSVYFVGTATTIISYPPFLFVTDPNFLHEGDHVHLGPGVTGTRQTNPAFPLDQLPAVDFVLLSHYHADHFDAEVERRLRRNLPIVSTKHAYDCLVNGAEGKGEAEGGPFTAVHGLDTWQGAVLRKPGKDEAIRVRAMPGKHVPDGIIGTLNDLAGAVPPTNGWMLELGKCTSQDESSFECGYRIYISGDTLLVDDLKEIPKRYEGQNIDLMLAHLGGTTIPSPKVPLLMVTMDAEQGVKLLRLVNPDLTIPIHYDDYDVFLSPLEDFKKKIEEAGLTEKVVYLDRGDQYNFDLKFKQ